MKRHSLRNCSLIFLALLLMLAFTIPTLAEGGGQSEEKEVTVNGYTYNFWSYIYAGVIYNTPYANAGTAIRAPKQTVPAGWMYSQSKLYTNAGSLKATSTANTNSSAGYYLNSDTASLKPADSDTLYYGIGTAGFWNGTDYLYYTTYKTPSFKP